MDENTSEPTIQIVKRGFWLTKKRLTILATLIGLISFVILMITLNYFDIIVPFISLPQKLLIACPIAGQNCTQPTPIKFNNQPAAGYKVASKSAVLNPIKIVDTKQFVLPPFRQEDPVGLNQSFILGDSCYTITYTVPYDAQIAQITKLPLNKSSQIITLGSESIKINNQDLNLILQIQKRPLENGQTDQEKCPVYNLDPANFGEHQQITSDLFKNELE